MAQETKKVDATAIAKAPRLRSPAYPAISLRKALERAKQFYKPQREHPAPITAALDVWEFKPKSSGGLQTIAALKQFGLMSEFESANARQIQLTDLALRIVRDEREPSPDRESLIKRAALLPKIYAEMWAKWGASFAAHATMSFFLVHEKKYNEASIAALIADYKDTVKFAKLSESDKTPAEESGGAGKSESPILPPLPPTPPSPGAKLMEGERIVFTHEIEPTHGVRILASGEVDESMLGALERFIAQKRQNRRKLDLGQDLKRIDDEMGQVVRAAVEPKIRAEMEPIIRSSMPSDADDATIENMLQKFIDGWMEQHYKRSVL